jgi:hypothetical protein
MSNCCAETARRKQFNTVISNPSYPDPTPSLLDARRVGVNSSFQTRSRTCISVHHQYAQLALNQTLKKGWRISPFFNINRGVHQLRNRNINAPYPGTPLDPFITQERSICCGHTFQSSAGQPVRTHGNSLSKNLNVTVQIPSTKKYLKTQVSDCSNMV